MCTCALPVCGGQRATGKSRFSLTAMWLSGSECGLAGVVPLRHFVGVKLLDFKSQYNSNTEKENTDYKSTLALNIFIYSRTIGNPPFSCNFS